MLIVFKCLQSLIKQIFSKHQSNFYSRDNFPSQLTQIKPEARTKFCLNNHKWTVKDEIFRELCIAVSAENTRLIAKFGAHTKMLNICLILPETCELTAIISLWSHIWAMHVFTESLSSSAISDQSCHVTFPHPRQDGATSLVQSSNGSFSLVEISHT